MKHLLILDSGSVKLQFVGDLRPVSATGPFMTNVAMIHEAILQTQRGPVVYFIAVKIGTMESEPNIPYTPIILNLVDGSPILKEYMAVMSDIHTAPPGIAGRLTTQ